MDRVRQPALVVECPLAEHRVELDILLRRPGIANGRGETLPFDRALGEPFQDLRGLDVRAVSYRVGTMSTAWMYWWRISPCGRYSLRPGHDAHVGDPAFVPGEPFPVGNGVSKAHAHPLQ